MGNTNQRRITGESVTVLVESVKWFAGLATGLVAASAFAFEKLKGYGAGCMISAQVALLVSAALAGVALFGLAATIQADVDNMESQFDYSSRVWGICFLCQVVFFLAGATLFVVAVCQLPR